jgi:hypothetical protein
MIEAEERMSAGLNRSFNRRFSWQSFVRFVSFHRRQHKQSKSKQAESTEGTTYRFAAASSYLLLRNGEVIRMGKLSRISIVAVLSLPLFAAGCAEHRRVYAWGPGETTYYAQWEHETHRDHLEWERRNDSDHNAYWKWRHNHHD